MNENHDLSLDDSEELMDVLRGRMDCETLEMMRDRMMGFIFPNTPVTNREKRSFEKACKYQAQHEAELRKTLNNVLPEGANEFKIGNFSMRFVEGYSEKITRKTICDAAYSVLLRAGLLYRGVER